MRERSVRERCRHSVAFLSNVRRKLTTFVLSRFWCPDFMKNIGEIRSCADESVTMLMTPFLRVTALQMKVLL